MRFSSFAILAASVLSSQCNAFSSITSTTRQTTVVRNTLSHDWTMMPEEPTPEVGFRFHVSCLISNINVSLLLPPRLILRE
jgi:hypothetical protein